MEKKVSCFLSMIHIEVNNNYYCLYMIPKFRGAFFCMNVRICCIHYFVLDLLKKITGQGNLADDLVKPSI